MACNQKKSFLETNQLQLSKDDTTIHCFLITTLLVVCNTKVIIIIIFHVSTFIIKKSFYVNNQETNIFLLFL